MNAPSLTTLHDDYEKRWRKFLLYINPLAILALIICLLLEQPSQQALQFDIIAYSIATVVLIIVEILLWLKPNLFCRLLTFSIVALALFFLARLSYLMTLLGQDVNIPAQLSEGMYWMPLIFLLAMALPRASLSRKVNLMFISLVNLIALAFVIRALYLGDWGAVYAVAQLALANIALRVSPATFSSR